MSLHFAPSTKDYSSLFSRNTNYLVSTFIPHRCKHPRTYILTVGDFICIARINENPDGIIDQELITDQLHKLTPKSAGLIYPIWERVGDPNTFHVNRYSAVMYPKGDKSRPVLYEHDSNGIVTSVYGSMDESTIDLWKFCMDNNLKTTIPLTIHPLFPIKYMNHEDFDTSPSDHVLVSIIDDEECVKDTVMKEAINSLNDNTGSADPAVSYLVSNSEDLRMASSNLKSEMVKVQWDESMFNPSQSHQQPRLVLLVGIPCLGKSTIFRALANLYPHEIFYDTQDNHKSKKSFYKSLTKHMNSNRKYVIADRNNVTVDQREDLIEQVGRDCLEEEPLFISFISLMENSMSDLVEIALRRQRIRGEGHQTLKNPDVAEQVITTFARKFEALSDDDDILFVNPYNTIDFNIIFIANHLKLDSRSQSEIHKAIIESRSFEDKIRDSLKVERDYIELSLETEETINRMLTSIFGVKVGHQKNLTVELGVGNKTSELINCEFTFEMKELAINDNYIVVNIRVCDELSSEYGNDLFIKTTLQFDRDISPIRICRPENQIGCGIVRREYS